MYNSHVACARYAADFTRQRLLSALCERASSADRSRKPGAPTRVFRLAASVGRALSRGRRPPSPCPRVVFVETTRCCKREKFSARGYGSRRRVRRITPYLCYGLVAFGRESNTAARCCLDGCVYDTCLDVKKINKRIIVSRTKSRV